MAPAKPRRAAPHHMQSIPLPALNFAQFAWTSFTEIFTGMLAFLATMKLADEIFGAGKTAQKLAAAFQRLLDRPSFSRAYVSAAYLSELAFGPKLLSWRAVCVSVVASLGWLTTLAAVSLEVYGRASWFHNPVFLPEVRRNAWFFLPASIAIDFLAVCLTRRMLLSALDKSSSRKLCMLALNLALTALLFYAVYGALKWMKIGEPPMDPLTSLQVWAGGMFQLDMSFHFLHDVHATPDGPGSYALTGGDALVDYMFPEGMVFAASLLTSFWFLAHILAYWAYGFANKSRVLARALVGESAIKSRPILSMAGVSCLLALFPAWLISLLVWAFIHR